MWKLEPTDQVPTVLVDDDKDTHTHTHSGGATDVVTSSATSKVCDEILQTTRVFCYPNFRLCFPQQNEPTLRGREYITTAVRKTCPVLLNPTDKNNITLKTNVLHAT